MKFCKSCKQVKEETEFHKSKYTKDKLYRYCKICSKEKRSHWPSSNKTIRKQQCRKRSLMTLFKLTEADYDKMLFNQHNKCAICEKEYTGGKKLSVDHDRFCCNSIVSCGKCVRGLLCYRCNTALGWFENNKQNVMSYLHEYLKEQEDD